MDDRNNKPLRLLVLSRDPQTAEGGIAVFVATELKRLSDEIIADPLWIGRRDGESAFGTISRLLGDVASVRAQLRKKAYDVVQLNVSMNFRSLFREYWFCRTVQRARNGRILVVFHGWDSGLARRIRESRLLSALFRRSIGAADRILVLARSFADELVGLGLEHSKISIIGQSFDDLSLIEFESFPARKRKEILFMARLVPEKGASELVSAFEAGAESMWPDWYLTIAGDGPSREPLEDQIAKSRFSDRITLAGYVRGAEKIELLRRASVFALPTSYNEGMPISVVEAMSAGCALLCSNVAGLGDILEDRVHGRVLDSTSVGPLQEGLSDLLTDDRCLSACQRACHGLAWRDMSARSVVNRIESHITEIAICN